MRKIIVDNKFNNKKLQAFLQFNFNGLSSSMFFKSLRKKDIKINSKRVNENINVYENDVIEIYLNDEFLFNTVELDIIYEDDNILVINITLEKLEKSLKYSSPQFPLIILKVVWKEMF